MTWGSARECELTWENSSRQFSLCLAIEEPELFQHPPQARTFAKVLRELVSTSPQGRTQVMYATHNPVFIDPKGYHQVRRLGRAAGEDHPVTEVWQATEGDLCRTLDGLVDKKVIRSRTEGTLGGAPGRGLLRPCRGAGRGTRGRGSDHRLRGPVGDQPGRGGHQRHRGPRQGQPHDFRRALQRLGRALLRRIRR
ncbi:AAA family ATPase [Streptomyces sp. PSKA28]|uniref:AAA family ATPase n=1 Tax=Streptomyces himalayensis subsp. himalayensis TaxID=2756131 RepID=A0A7W0DSU5_9ACTN|nr:AAA family ATPase [Streptomyces himalayensis subsp. himalayensis]